MTEQHDLIIVGGGLVGTALGAALAGSPLKIMLIDATPPIKKEQTRYIALNDASVSFFKHINVWPQLAHQATPIKAVHVSHKGHFGKVTIRAEECQLNALGHVISEAPLQQALFDKMNAAHHIQVLRPALLHDIQEELNQIILTVNLPEKTQTLTGRWLAAADGSGSFVRRWLKAPSEQLDYQQSAIVTLTQLSLPHEGMAYERFLKKGAIAMLPFGNDQAATIWTDDNEAIDALMQLSDTDFLLKLQENVGSRLGRLIETSKRNRFPLQRTTVKQNSSERIILLGNAAHTQHPIAAQGLNLSLYEVALLIEGLLKPTPVFSLSKALSFRQQFFSQQLSHQLQGLFSQDFFMINGLRSLSLFGLDSFLPLKIKFAKAALGRAGHVPFSMIEDN